MRLGKSVLKYVMLSLMVWAWFGSSILGQKVQTSFNNPFLLRTCVVFIYSIFLPIWCIWRYFFADGCSKSSSISDPAFIGSFSWSRMCVLGLFLGTCAHASGVTWYISLPYTYIATNCAIYQSNIIFVYILSVILLGEPLQRSRIGSVVIAVCGICLICFASDIQAIVFNEAPKVVSTSGASPSFFGYAMCILSTVLYGLYQVLVSKFASGSEIDPPNLALPNAIRLTGLMGLIPGLISIPIVFILHIQGIETFSFPFDSSDTIKSFALLLLCEAVSMGSIISVLTMASPNEVAIGSLFVLPLSASYDFLTGIPFSLWSLMGMLFITSSFIIFTFFSNEEEDIVDSNNYEDDLSAMMESGIEIYNDEAEDFEFDDCISNKNQISIPNESYILHKTNPTEGFIHSNRTNINLLMLDMDIINDNQSSIHSSDENRYDENNTINKRISFVSSTSALPRWMSLQSIRTPPPPVLTPGKHKRDLLSSDYNYRNRSRIHSVNYNRGVGDESNSNLNLTMLQQRPLEIPLLLTSSSPQCSNILTSGNNTPSRHLLLQRDHTTNSVTNNSTYGNNVLNATTCKIEGVSLMHGQSTRSSVYPPNSRHSHQRTPTNVSSNDRLGLSCRTNSMMNSRRIASFHAPSLLGPLLSPDRTSKKPRVASALHRQDISQNNKENSKINSSVHNSLNLNKIMSTNNNVIVQNELAKTSMSLPSINHHHHHNNHALMLMNLGCLSGSISPVSGGARTELFSGGFTPTSPRKHAHFNSSVNFKPDINDVDEVGCCTLTKNDINKNLICDSSFSPKSFSTNKNTEDGINIELQNKIINDEDLLTLNSKIKKDKLYMNHDEENNLSNQFATSTGALTCGISSFTEGTSCGERKNFNGDAVIVMNNLNNIANDDSIINTNDNTTMFPNNAQISSESSFLRSNFQEDSENIFFQNITIDKES